MLERKLRIILNSGLVIWSTTEDEKALDKIYNNLTAQRNEFMFFGKDSEQVIRMSDISAVELR